MLASDRIQGNFCSLASVALAMVLAGGSYVTGQIIVPAAEINGQSGDFGAQSSDVNQQATKHRRCRPMPKRCSRTLVLR